MEIVFHTHNGRVTEHNGLKSTTRKKNRKEKIHKEIYWNDTHLNNIFSFLIYCFKYFNAFDIFYINAEWVKDFFSFRTFRF